MAEAQRSERVTPLTLESALKKYWGYDRFLPLQKEAMDCALSGRDSLVVLPTGGGKSLCFQAPAVTMPGLALVVSPLISLMKDQVDALTECGVPAARTDSSLSPRERAAVNDKIRSGVLKLLYVSPERLALGGLAEFLGRRPVSLVAVDEAHCISVWGHDFRPEYRQLGELKKVLPGVPVHAYTATATQRVRDDIIEQLQLKDPLVLVGSFDRPNLIYKVERRTELIGQVRAVMDRHKNESGIIYCIRRTDVDELCSELLSLGYRAAPYHAGMDADKRRQNQDDFLHEKVDVIVATVAFGMGIDKSNVRYVIHSAMPKSLEYYQQESGRAGRDGLDAECCLLYSGADFQLWKRIITGSESEGQDIAMAKLEDMNDYCGGVTCRHQAILRYFGQDLGKSDCGGCDVCLGGLECVSDSLIVAQKILSCVVRVGERFGGDYVSSVLTGSTEERILVNGHDKLSTYGLLSDFSKRIVRDWVEQLGAQNCVRKTGDYNVLKVTDEGRQVLKGLKTPRLLKPAVKAAKKAKIAKETWEGVDEGLFEELRVLRRTIADKEGVPAFIVFGDAALREMCRVRPSTTQGFLLVWGVGAQKQEKYGGAFVAAIRRYCGAHSIPMDQS
jgi:ATP-dependent DNA helicase RecQ